jgi:hypothetical protein
MILSLSYGDDAYKIKIVRYYAVIETDLVANYSGSEPALVR